jgi:hypothetical protein
VKGYRVLNVTTGKVQIVRTVKFMETTSAEHLMDRQDADEPPTLGGPSPTGSQQLVPTVTQGGDIIPLQRDTSTDSAMVPYGPTHAMITRSRARHIEATTDPEDAGPSKRQVVAPSESGTKRLKMTQDRAVVNDRQLVVDGGQVMAASEEVPRTYADATTGADQDEWKKAIARKLESLTSNKTWKLKIEDVGITYDGMLGTELVTYFYADWAGNRDDRRSVSGMVLTMCGAPVV